MNKPGVSVIDSSMTEEYGQSIWDMYNQRMRDIHGGSRSTGSKTDRIVPTFFYEMLQDIAVENPDIKYGGPDFWEQWHEKEGELDSKYDAEGRDTLSAGALHPYRDMETIFNMMIQGRPIFKKKEEYLKDYWENAKQTGEKKKVVKAQTP